jgi:hypothetical protein
MNTPLSPQAALDLKAKTIYPKVIEVVNSLLVKHMKNGRVILRKDDVVNALTLATGVSDSTVYEEGWLDFEFLYRREGWKVSYDDGIWSFESKDILK